MQYPKPNHRRLARPATVVLLAALSFQSSIARDWSPVRSPTANDLTAVHFSDASHGYASGAFGTLLKTTDGGASWTTVPTPVNHSFVSVWSSAPDVATIGRVGLYHTTDCGQTWGSPPGDFDQFFGSIFDIIFTRADTGFFVKEGNIFRTTDAGAQWSQVGGSGQFLDDLHYAGGQTVYATGGITYSEITGFVSRGEMERSRDGGATWAPLALDGVSDIYAAAWRSESEGYLFTFTGAAHRTADGGDTWDLVTSAMTDTGGAPLPALLIDTIIDRDGRIVGVDFSGNFLESDDGATWTVTPGSRDPFSAITGLPDGSLVAVGNSGAIWRSPAPGPKKAPTITTITLGTDPKGPTVTIAATGTPGSTYRLSSSADLAAWAPESSLVAPAPRFDFTLGRPLDPHRYYRIEETSPDPKPITP